MLKQLLSCAGLTTLLAVASLSGAIQSTARTAQDLTQLQSQSVKLPGTEFDVVIGVPVVEPGKTRIKPGRCCTNLEIINKIKALIFVDQQKNL